MNMEELNTGNNTRVLDTSELEAKWGVSRDQIDEAVRHVGTERSRVEEYLVNQKWQQERNHEAAEGKHAKGEELSFQKRELNEDETY